MTDGICPFAQWIPLQPHTYSQGGMDKVGFCDHTAGGFYSTLADPNFWNSLGISVHFSIARDGRIAQTVNIFDRAYAQGRDANDNPVGPNSPGITWPPFVQMGQRNPNEYLISTEHEDAYKIGGKTVFVPGSKWTDEQYQADLMVKNWCIEEFQRVRQTNILKFGIDSLAGHYMFDPVKRLNCPGRFWVEEYHQSLWDDLSGEEIMIRHNAEGLFWRNQVIVPSVAELQPSQECGAFFDFNLPMDAKLIRLEARTVSGRLQIFDGDDKFAGEIGNVRSTIDVFVGANGSIKFGGRDDCKTEFIGVLGYWR